MHETARCSKCEATTVAGQVCWLCGAAPETPITATLVSDTATTAYQANPFRPPVPVADEQAFPIVSIVLMAALVLVFVALYAVAPGLAILAAIITAPALVRTAVVVARRQRQGNAVSFAEKSTLVIGSIACVIAALSATAVTFFVACSMVCFGAVATDGLGRGGEQVFSTMLIVSGVTAALVGLSVLFLLWRRTR